MDCGGFTIGVFSFNKMPSDLLFDLYSMRKKVFYERLSWKVQVLGEHEVDQYDTVNTDYVVVSYQAMPVAGVRMISTVNPYMANGVFASCFSQSLPSEADVIESSRFFVDKERVKKNGLSCYPITSMLLKAMVDYARKSFAVSIITIVSKPMERIVKNAGCLYSILDIGYINEAEPLYLISIEVTKENLASLSTLIEARWPNKNAGLFSEYTRLPASM